MTLKMKRGMERTKRIQLAIINPNQGVTESKDNELVSVWKKNKGRDTCGLSKLYEYGCCRVVPTPKCLICGVEVTVWNRCCRRIVCVGAVGATRNYLSIECRIIQSKWSLHVFSSKNSSWQRKNQVQHSHQNNKCMEMGSNDLQNDNISSSHKLYSKNKTIVKMRN